MKDEQLDSLFRGALEDIDGVPPQAKNWDKEDIFDRIQLGLNGDNTKTRRSFFDLAAAVIVLITAITYSISFFTKSNVDKLFPAVVAEVPDACNMAAEKADATNLQAGNFSQVFQEVSLPSDEIQPIASLVAKPISFELPTLNETMRFEPVNFVDNNKSKDNKIHTENYPSVNILLPFAKKNEKVLSENQQKNSKVNLSLPVGVAYSAGSVAPVVSLNSSFNLKENSKNTTQLNLGATAYGLMHQNESDELEVAPLVFAETSLGFESNKNKFISGHAVGVGYQLNNSDLVEGKAVKLNYTLSVKKRIKVAAEALVSEGFSKVQPGIKLTFI